MFWGQVLAVAFLQQAKKRDAVDRINCLLLYNNNKEYETKNYPHIQKERRLSMINKVCNWYFNRGALPYWCILLLDSSAVFITGLVVYYIQHGGLSLAQNFWPVAFGLLVCLLVFIVSFFSFHTFRGVMRYSSFVYLHRLAYSTICACAVVCLLH